MKVNVRFKGFPPSDSLVEHTTRRLHQHLSRFGGRVASVDVRISDLNGPRGGRDKRSLFTVRMPGLPTLQVEDLHEDFYVAVDQAVARVARSVGRSIERSRRHHAGAVEL